MVALTKHIVISIPTEIWPEMKAEYERLSGTRSVVLISYLGLPLVRALVGPRGLIRVTVTVTLYLTHPPVHPRRVP